MGSMRPLRDDDAPTAAGPSRPVAVSRSRTLFKRVRPAALCALLAQSLLLTHGLAAQPPRDACESASEVAGSLLRQWQGLFADRGSLSTAEFDQRSTDLVERTLALEMMAQGIFREDWEELRPVEQTEFLEALGISLRDALLSFLEREMRGGQPTLTPTGNGDESTAVEYSLDTPRGESRRLTLYLVAVGGDACRVVDVEYDGERLSRKYRDRVEDLIDDYSFPYMLAKLSNRDYLILEDFESSPVGRLPVGWAWRDGDANKDKPYRVREEDGNRYLEARDEGQSVILAKEIRWDLDEYPYISFRWRVHRIPEGGDERTEDRVDSAAGVYVTIKKVAFGRIPESVKYVWSSTLPVGAATRRGGIGRPWQVVIGSGKEGLGEWHTYVFDLRDAYRKTFGGNPGSKAQGVGVLSDANSTHSQAYADYDDFRVLKAAPEGVTGGVVQRLRPVRSRDR